MLFTTESVISKKRGFTSTFVNAGNNFGMIFFASLIFFSNSWRVGFYGGVVLGSLIILFICIYTEDSSKIHLKNKNYEEYLINLLVISSKNDRKNKFLKFLMEIEEYYFLDLKELVEIKNEHNVNLNDNLKDIKNELVYVKTKESKVYSENFKKISKIIDESDFLKMSNMKNSNLLKNIDKDKNKDKEIDDIDSVEKMSVLTDYLEDVNTKSGNTKNKLLINNEIVGDYSNLEEDIQPRILDKKNRVDFIKKIHVYFNHKSLFSQFKNTKVDPETMNISQLLKAIDDNSTIIFRKLSGIGMNKENDIDKKVNIF